MNCQSSFRTRIFSVAFVLVGLLTAAAGRAVVHLDVAAQAPLANRIPAGVLFYMGWNGSPAHWPGYAKSTLAQFLKRSHFAAFLADGLPALLKSAAWHHSALPVTATSQALIQKDISLLARHPWAFYCLPAAKADAGLSTALLIDAGPDGKAVLAAMRSQMATILPAGAAGVCGRSGSICYLFTNARGKMRTALNGRGRRLVTDAKYRATIEQLPATGGYAVYADLTGLLAAEDAYTGDNPAIKSYWKKVKAEFSLGGYKAFSEGGGLVDGHWQDGAFLGMRNSRPSHGKAVHALLARVPAGATSMTVVHFAMPKLYGFAMASADLYGQRAVVKQTLSQVASMTGISLRKDVLASFGSHWLFYTPARAANPTLGFLMVNKLRHPTRLANAIVIAAPLALMGINAQLEQHGIKHAAAVMRNLTVGKVTIYYLHSPKSPVSPAWALDGNTFYFSLNPASIADALKHPGKPITTDADFRTAMANLNLPTQAIEAVGYEDQGALLPQGYNMVTQVLAMAGSYLHLAQPLANPLPPLNRLRPLLSPMASASWVDAAGWHLRQTDSFPGAGLLAPTGWGSAPAMVNPAVGLLIELGASSGHQTMSITTMPPATNQNPPPQ